MKTTVVFLLWTLMMGTASAAVYKCTGADGKIEFSDKSCAGAESEAMNLQYNTFGDPGLSAGMTASQVRQTWGEPDTIKTSKKKKGAREEWRYQRDGYSQKVVLVDGRVTEISKQAAGGAMSHSTSDSAPRLSKSPSTKASAAKTSEASKRAEKVGERRFIRKGMSAGEVRSRIGTADSREDGNCRERTKVNSQNQMKTVRDLCEKCWVYDPAEGDPQTQTQVCFQNSRVSSVKRTVIR
ncbi:MAG: DUF4124 domain-containing protein [Betaproteobacteria bacterium]|nr:DUF4124 domain-containing protein [Betaproteobacteria bacterium]